MVQTLSDAEIYQKFVDHGWSDESARFFIEHRTELLGQKIIARMFGMKHRFPSPSNSTKADIPSHLRWHIWERDNFTCQNCGSRRFLTIDHIKAEHLGGGLDDENLQTLCATCNSSKGHRPIASQA